MAVTDWNPLLRGEFEEPYWRELQSFVAAERAAHAVYPPPEVIKTLFLLKPLPPEVQRLQTRLWTEFKSGR